MKKCTQCEEMKGVEQFYKAVDKRSKKPYRHAACRECVSAYNKERMKIPEVKSRKKEANEKWQNENPIAYKIAIKNWQQTNAEVENARRKKYRGENIEKLREQGKRYYLNNKKKVHARYLINYAVKMNRMEKLSCQYPNCKSDYSEGHHWDYNSPLQVTWLCSSHHALADGVKRAGEKQGIIFNPVTI